jgi:hypothetical protein
MERNRRIWRKRTQLLPGVIGEALHELRVELAGNDIEFAPGFGNSWTTRRGTRHFRFTI